MVNTKSWTIGHYPTPKAPPKTIEQTVAELRMFGHHESADAIERLLGRVEALEAKITEVRRLTSDAQDAYYRDIDGMDYHYHHISPYRESMDLADEIDDELDK